MAALPPIGLGTMKIDDSAAITTGLELGYRHLDTAQLYDNEDVVGDGLARSDIARDDVTIATKLWYDTLEYESVFRAVEESRDLLGVETIDLLYVHRPVAEYDPVETLQAFDELRDRGTIEHVGVSNFTREELATARDHLDAPIFAHQIELHPLYYTPELVADNHANDEAVVAYSPLAGGRVGEIEVLCEIADERNVTPGQVALAWLLEKGVHPIPKAGGRDHQRENLAAVDIELAAAEIDRIDGIEREYEIYPE